MRRQISGRTRERRQTPRRPPVITRHQRVLSRQVFSAVGSGVRTPGTVTGTAATGAPRRDCRRV